MAMGHGLSKKRHNAPTRMPSSNLAKNCPRRTCTARLQVLRHNYWQEKADYNMKIHLDDA